MSGRLICQCNSTACALNRCKTTFTFLNAAPFTNRLNKNEWFLSGIALATREPCISHLERSRLLSRSVRPIHPTPSFPHHMPITSKQPNHDSSACFFRLKSHRYLRWLAHKCALVFHSVGDRSEIIFHQWLTGKQSLSSSERWLLTLGLYR